MAIETVSKNAAVYPTAPVNTNMTSVSSAGTVTESVSTEKVALNPEVGKIAVNSNMDTVKKVYSSEDEERPEESEAANAALRKALDTINKKIVHTECQFGFHDATNRIMIKIIDKDTKEVLKEFPPEETLEMIAKAWELAGILMDEKL